jgi:hypothetical protein
MWASKSHDAEIVMTAPVLTGLLVIVTILQSLDS